MNVYFTPLEGSQRSPVLHVLIGVVVVGNGVTLRGLVSSETGRVWGGSGVVQSLSRGPELPQCESDKHDPEPLV